MQELRIDNNYILTAPLLDVLNRLRISLTNGKLRDIRPNGDDIVVTCPHHAGGHEHSPACNIYIGNNPKIGYGYFHCFVCNTKGNFIKFVQECFESSEEYAKQWLIDNFGIKARLNTELDDAINLAKAQRKNKYIWEPIDKTILDNFQSWHPYMAQRKLSREVCELFSVKYDPKYRQIIFPCFDVKGNLIMLPRRSIDTKTFYLDKGVEKPVYCLDYLIRNNYDKAIITEGPIDALTAYTYGYPACATMGRISDFQIQQLNKSTLKVIYAVFDNDEWGRKFTETLKKYLTKRILIVDVKIPDGKKDINDLSREEFINLMETYKQLG